MKLSYRKLMVSMFLGFVALAATQSSFAMNDGFSSDSNEGDEVYRQCFLGNYYNYQDVMCEKNDKANMQNKPEQKDQKDKEKSEEGSEQKNLEKNLEKESNQENRRNEISDIKNLFRRIKYSGRTNFSINGQSDLSLKCGSNITYNENNMSGQENGNKNSKNISFLGKKQRNSSHFINNNNINMPTQIKHNNINMLEQKGAAKIRQHEIKNAENIGICKPFVEDQNLNKINLFGNNQRDLSKKHGFGNIGNNINMSAQIVNQNPGNIGLSSNINNDNKNIIRITIDDEYLNEDPELENFKKHIYERLFNKTYSRQERGPLTTFNYLTIIPDGTGSKIKIMAFDPNKIRSMDSCDLVKHENKIKYLEDDLSKKSTKQGGGFYNCLWRCKKLSIDVLCKGVVGSQNLIINKSEDDNMVEFKVDFKPTDIKTIIVTAHRELGKRTPTTVYFHDVQNSDIANADGEIPKTGDEYFDYLFSM